MRFIMRPILADIVLCALLFSWTGNSFSDERAEAEESPEQSEQSEQSKAPFSYLEASAANALSLGATISSLGGVAFSYTDDIYLNIRHLRVEENNFAHTQEIAIEGSLPDRDGESRMGASLGFGYAIYNRAGNMVALIAESEMAFTSGDPFELEVGPSLIVLIGEDILKGKINFSYNTSFAWKAELLAELNLENLIEREKLPSIFIDLNFYSYFLNGDLKVNSQVGVEIPLGKEASPMSLLLGVRYDLDQNYLRSTHQVMGFVGLKVSYDSGRTKNILRDDGQKLLTVD